MLYVPKHHKVSSLPQQMENVFTITNAVFSLDTSPIILNRLFEFLFYFLFEELSHVFSCNKA
jgi:hypothetical protein